MIRFDYARPDTLQDAVRAGTPDRAAFLAGGTNLVDLMKENVARPLEVVDINRLPLREIVELDGGGLRLGALVTNSRTAYDARVQERYPMLASAILAGASPQLRNAATNGGNLNQRTLLLFLRCRHALQQAFARPGLRSDRRVQPRSRGARHQRSVHRHPPVGHVRGARGIGGDGAGDRTRRRPLDRLCGLPPAAGR